MKKEEQIKLYCLSYAGGSSVFYRDWIREIDPRIQVLPLEIPGHGRRFNESFCKNIFQVVEDLKEQIVHEIHNPYAIFGHSMGALLAYELACSMQRLRAPIHLFLSSYQPPNIPYHMGAIEKMSDGELKERILSMGGTSREIIDNGQMWDIFRKIFISDFELLEKYNCKKEPERLYIDFTILCGMDDHVIDKQNLIAWRNITEGKCQFVEYPGGHFYINHHREKIIKLIEETLIKN